MTVACLSHPVMCSHDYAQSMKDSMINIMLTHLEDAPESISVEMTRIIVQPLVQAMPRPTSLEPCEDAAVLTITVQSNAKSAAKDVATMLLTRCTPRVKQGVAMQLVQMVRNHLMGKDGQVLFLGGSTHSTY